MAQPVTSQPKPIERLDGIPLCDVDGSQKERVESVRAESKTSIDFCCGCCWRYCDDEYDNKHYTGNTTRAPRRYDTKVYRRVTRDVDYEFDPDIDDGNDMNVGYFDPNPCPNVYDGNNTNVDGFDPIIDERFNTNVDEGISHKIDDIIIPNVECIQVDDKYVCADYSICISKNDEPGQVCTSENLYVSESSYTQADSGYDYSNDVCTSNDDNTTYDCSDNYGGSDD